MAAYDKLQQLCGMLEVITMHMRCNVSLSVATTDLIIVCTGCHVQ